MVSKGLLIKMILLLLPVAFSYRLTPEEDAERHRTCGLKKNPSSKLVQNETYYVMISPMHLLISGEHINEHFNLTRCEQEDHTVTGMIKFENYVNATLLGDCINPNRGMILVESHLNATEFYCVLDIKQRKDHLLQNNEPVIIINNYTHKGRDESWQCFQANESKFCAVTYQNNTGILTVNRNNRFYVVGLLSKVNFTSTTYDHFWLEGYYLPGDEICERTGVCDNSNSNLGASIDLDSKTTPRVSTITIPPTTPSSSPSTNAKTTIVLTSVPPTSVSPTVSISNNSSPSTPRPVTTEVVSTKTQPDATTPGPTKKAEAVPTTVAQGPVTPEEKSRATEVPKKTDEQEVSQPSKQKSDCEEENLCFKEDIFSSSKPHDVFMILFSVLTILMIFQ